MLPDSIKDAKRVFAGVRFDVHAVDLPGRDGESHRREVIVHPGAVLILPLMDDGCVVLIKNERFAVGKSLWELPAGTLEPAEGPAKCAARELIEETGYEAKRIEKLAEFYTTPGFCTEKMWAYVAQDLTHVGQDLDESERIEVHPTPWDKAMAMTRDGEIVDGKTMTALLYYDAFMKGTNH